MGYLLIEDGLVYLLKADATLVTLLGATSADSHIHPMIMPQRADLPQIVYTKISDLPNRVMGGQTGLSEAHFQLSIWTGMDPATNGGYAQAAAIADQVRRTLEKTHGYPGTITIGSNSIVIDFITVDDGPDLYDSETGRGLAMMAKIKEVRMFYRNQVPS